MEINSDMFFFYKWDRWYHKSTSLGIIDSSSNLPIISSKYYLFNKWELNDKMDSGERINHTNFSLPKFPGFRNHHGKLHATPRDVQGVGHTLGHGSSKTSAQQFGRHCQHQTTCGRAFPILNSAWKSNYGFKF